MEVNGQEAKAAREVKVGDTVSLRRDAVTRTAGPTKRGRRELDDAQRGWGDRWSASLNSDGKN